MSFRTLCRYIHLFTDSLGVLDQIFGTMRVSSPPLDESHQYSSLVCITVSMFCTFCETLRMFYPNHCRSWIMNNISFAAVKTTLTKWKKKWALVAISRIFLSLSSITQEGSESLWNLCFFLLQPMRSEEEHYRLGDKCRQSLIPLGGYFIIWAWAEKKTPRVQISDGIGVNARYITEYIQLYLTVFYSCWPLFPNHFPVNDHWVMDSENMKFHQYSFHPVKLKGENKLQSWYVKVATGNTLHQWLELGRSSNIVGVISFKILHVAHIQTGAVVDI